MEFLVLSIHLLVCACLIGLVLLQRSEGGALGMGGGGGSSSLMSGRGAADALAKMTSVAGGFFLATSLGLTVLSGAAASPNGSSVFDRIAPSATDTVIPPPAADAPAEPATAPDPTESSIEPETQVASLAPGPAPAAAAPSDTARAAPLPTTAAPPPATGRVTPTPTPASGSGTAARPPAASSGSPPPTRPIVIPETSGGVSGITLDDDGQGAESGSDGGLEAVRRERAGPDQ